MTAWAKMKVRVERTTTEFADIDFDVDMDDYTEWLGGLVPTQRSLVEYIKSDSEYPMNLPIQGAAWRKHDLEFEVTAP